MEEVIEESSKEKSIGGNLKILRKLRKGRRRKEIKVCPINEIWHKDEP
jgi:hypothetical protein